MSAIALLIHPSVSTTPTTSFLRSPLRLADELRERGIEVEVLRKSLPEAPENRVLVYLGPEGPEEAPVDVRNRLVVIGGPGDAERDDVGTVQRLGLLGIVSDEAWTLWSNNMLARGGFTGRADVAADAGLVWNERSREHAFDSSRRASLLDVLGAYFRHLSNRGAPL